jgi:hypothetical protein
MVPIHLTTKFSSSLFILVFGIALAVVYLPHVGTPRWSAKRKRLLMRGLVVFFWYKVLTIVEMLHLYEPEVILNTLLYKGFPVYVEILGFYALALVWVPFLLPLWRRIPLALQLASPAAIAFLAAYLYRNFDFWGLDIAQAILVEHEDHYTWGQLSRTPLVLVGLLVGDLVRRAYHTLGSRLALAGGFAGIGALLWMVFFWRALPGGVHADLVAIAKNVGKHPPELPFMLFSLGGAFLALGFTFAGGERMASWLRPVTVIGSNALQAFIFHIFVIFVFFRFLLDYWHSVSYLFALVLTSALIFMTALWIRANDWVQAKS